MSQIRGRPADVYFGEVADEEVNWREELTDDKDPDDEELAETPPDVVAIFGFDPKDLDSDD